MPKILSECETTPTPKQPRQAKLDIQQPSSRPLSRKRPYEGTPSPQRNHHGILTPLGQSEITLTPLQQREGPPTLRQQDPKTPSRQMKIEPLLSGQTPLASGQREPQLAVMSPSKAAQYQILHPSLDEDPKDPSEADAYDKPEKEVEWAGLAFLALIRDSIRDISTKTGLVLQTKSVSRRVLEFSRPLNENRDPNPHDIRIDDIDMTTHPDLSIRCTFGKEGERRTIKVVLEVRTLLSLTIITNAAPSAREGTTNYLL